MKPKAGCSVHVFKSDLSTNHDNHYVWEFNDSTICYRRAKIKHNKQRIIKIGSEQK